MSFGRFEEITQLGEGSSGILYKAFDPPLERMVALKVLREEHLKNEEFVRRFLKEGKVIARLSHPNIVTVYEVQLEQEPIYIVMELLEGRSLDKVIREETLSLRQIVGIGIDVAKALGYAHSKGIVHRDIKPSNIILSPHGEVKLTDFGIAQVADTSAAEKTQLGVVMGTPLYMSPEQISSQPLDGRSDLYSLGAVLYELTTGHCPFKADNLATLFRSIAEETPIVPDRSDDSLKPENIAAFQQIIMRCMNKNPAERFQDGKELADALIGCVRETETIETTIVQKSKPVGLWLTLATLLVGIALVCLYVFWPVPKQVINIGSEPGGARVFIDGNFEGETPLQLKLPIGKHEVRLNLANHYEWEAQIDLGKSNPEDLAVPLLPMEDNLQ